MNEGTIEDGIKIVPAKLDGAAIAMIGDGERSLKGGAKLVEGQAQSAIGWVQQTFGKAADQASMTAARVSGQAKDTYGRVTDQARVMGDRVEPLIKKQPYAALGVAAAVGLAVGLLFAARGLKPSKVAPIT